MKAELNKSSIKPIEELPIVSNFREVIETRDLSLMKNDLYRFLNLHCGFIAHYNIDSFKTAYGHPRDFAQVFIRHFDRDHRYFNGIYHYQCEKNKETGFSTADIKQAFYRIVDLHKEAIIGAWTKQRLRAQRHGVYLDLKKEFETDSEGLTVNCEACGNDYEVRVKKQGQDYTDFDIICCLFCGKQIKLY